MSSIINIALGIVLAWLLITRFHSIIGYILFPLKVLLKGVRGLPMFLFGILGALIIFFSRFVLKILPLALIITLALGLFYVLATFMPQPYLKYILILIFGGGLLLAFIVMLKEGYESYKVKASKHWIFVLLFVLTITTLIAIRIFNAR